MHESNPNLTPANNYEHNPQRKHQRPLSPANRLSITISRQPGTREGPICERLTQVLIEKTQVPWMLYDKNLIEKVISDHELPLEWAKYMPEDQGSPIQNLIQEIVGLHPSSWTLFEKTSETIVELAQRGHAIVVGRAAPMLCAELPQTFHVRLVGSSKRRVEYIQNTLNLSYEEATAYTDHLEGARKKYVKRYFNKNIDNALLYHLVIHTDKFADEHIATLIADGALAWHNSLAPAEPTA